MDIEKLRTEGARLVMRAQELMAAYDGKEMPKEVADQVTTLYGKADEVKARLHLAQQGKDAEEYWSSPAESPAMHTAWRPAGPSETNIAVDEKSWVEAKFMTPRGEVSYRQPIPQAVLKDRKAYLDAFCQYLVKGERGMKDYEYKTLYEGVDTAGGFLVPVDFQEQLIMKLPTITAVRPLARVITTNRDLVRFPRVNYTTDNKYTSGVRLTWTGEAPATATTHRVTDPLYGQVDIPIHTAMASMPVSNDLIEDAVFPVLDDASDLISQAFGLGEDDVFINGDGVSKPMGILSQVASSETATGGPVYVISNTSADIQNASDAWSGKRLMDLYYSVPIQYRRRGVWMMNSGTMESVENLVDAQKRPVIHELTMASLGTAEPSTIKGKPVYIDEFMPAVAANSFPILFGDLSGYVIIDRVGLSIQRLTEIYAETNLTVLLARKRVGGMLTDPWRMKVMKAGTS